MSTWTIRIDTEGSAAPQAVAAILDYATSHTVDLTFGSPLLFPGDTARIRASLATAGILRTDASWTCTLLRPDGVTDTLTLHDDGAHGDSLNADGIYGVGVPPAGGVGYYAATAVGSAPDVAPIAAVAYVELTDMQDLAIGPSDVYLSQNVPHAGDTLMVYAVIHNNSSRTASGVAVEFRDRQAATTLGISSVNIAIGGTATVAVPWLPAPPDTHDIEVQISPDVLDESNYANNAATRTIVLGLPRAVSHRVGPAGLWLANPYPNPTTDGVAFTFSIPRAAAVSLDAFDLLGRRVWRQQWSSLDAGIHSQQWDGRTSLGSRLPPGVYVCRLTVGEERLQRKFVLKH